MGSALLNTLEDQVVADVAGEIARQDAAGSEQARSPSAEALRKQVAERLAAHRMRRGGGQPQPTLNLDPAPGGPETKLPGSRSARIAATVAERYAQSQSYRAFLAAEAERAIQQARAAAEVAALNAQAVAAAQQRLLEAFDEAAIREVTPIQADPIGEQPALAEALQSEFQQTAGLEQNLWPDLGSAAGPRHRTHHRSRPQPHSAEPEPRTLEPSSGFTVRLYEDAASAAHVAVGVSPRIAASARANRYDERNEAESMALDEEIAFRQAPVFEEPAGPPMPLPANLIEFPRQLVASRKARPRYAEGPLRAEQDEPAPGDGQLRIFEVDPAQISTKPSADVEGEAAAMPQWTSIWLDTPTITVPSSEAGREAAASEDSSADNPAIAAPLLHVATIGRRAGAAAIDGAIAMTGLLAFGTAFVAISDPAIAWHAGLHTITSQMAQWIASQGLPLNWMLGGAAITGAVLNFLYQAMFFSFNVATPGMRSVRIGLCTFDDENPTRRAIRRRMLAMLLSACPLGLGFLWIALDEDRLAWHDRISRIYQRSY
ncbi:MAG TPA: RDD family protein [Acidobacteriaceae bacterium]|jgi:uncharacterized RDD family membrane protein YckC